jgi:RHS repeat-associated protein
MRRERLVNVTTPMGGRTEVTYFVNRFCDTSIGKYWDRNASDCFPQPVNGDHETIGLYNKYLVQKVDEFAVPGAAAVTTSYMYEGTPAWAFDVSWYANDNENIGWTVWRGYGTVTITKGTSRKQLRLFRGWDQDQRFVDPQPPGFENDPIVKEPRPVSVSTFDGSASYVDSPVLAGRTLEERDLSSTASPLQARRFTYEVRQTVPGSPSPYRPTWAGLTGTLETVYGGSASRQRRSTTTYNANLQPTSTLEEGWLGVTGDERCTITTYAENPSANMVTYPAMNKRVAGTCASTQLLSQSETYYDGSTTLGSPPTRGNPTRQRTKIDDTRYATTTTQYDAYGRPVKVIDPNGNPTTTTYEVPAGAPATLVPTRGTVTNALNQATVTEWQPEFAVPFRETDPNGNMTETWFDEFGRLAYVWLPTETVDMVQPAYQFSYDLTNRVVRSRRLVSSVNSGPDLRFQDTWVIYDGFWRERQTQSLSPEAGKLVVAETLYDARGLVRQETVAQAVTGTPGAYVGGIVWLNATRHVYDELGRETRNQWLRSDTLFKESTSAYDVDTVSVTGPDGRVVRQKLDGLGRTVATEEKDGGTWATSTYGYDLADRLTSVKDPENNTITYTYDLAGRRFTEVDPHRGNRIYVYDDAGNVTETLDHYWNWILTQYDALSRPVSRRRDGATGPLLAEWTYDTAPGGKGKLASETTRTASGNWVSTVVGYDKRGRPTGTSFTVPAGFPGLSGTYTTTQTYNRGDDVTSATYPAIGGLPSETVTTTYNETLGLPTKLVGLESYVWQRNYDDRGRATVTAFGPSTSWLNTTLGYDADQALRSSQTKLNGSTVVNEHTYAYDKTGNLTEDLTRNNGQAWRECFGYDDRSRLKTAKTVADSTACTGAVGGAQSYNNTYAYSPAGRLTSRTENGVSTGYTYPSPGSANALAPTTVGTDTYTWDPKGNLQSRGPAGAPTETYTWDIRGTLTSVTNASGTTSFLYDPSGQRLMRRAPDGKVTVYIGNHEVTANAAGTIVSAVRSYTFDGSLVATRTTPNKVDYLVADAAGSVELSLPSGGTAASVRSYTPYGRVRGQTGAISTDKGFIGQVADSSTKLSYLNARYYDSTNGVFISPDRLFSLTSVKSLNPYSYGFNNPTTFSDPSGLYSAYTFGLETANAALRAQNQSLIQHIGLLDGQIADLQDYIVGLQRDINNLLTYVGALEAELARQISLNHRLQVENANLKGRVAYLQGRVNVLTRQLTAQKQATRTVAAMAVLLAAGKVSKLFKSSKASSRTSTIRMARQQEIPIGVPCMSPTPDLPTHTGNPPPELPPVLIDGMLVDDTGYGGYHVDANSSGRRSPVVKAIVGAVGAVVAKLMLVLSGIVQPDIDTTGSIGRQGREGPDQRGELGPPDEQPPPEG